jgi:hypothetical protein
MDFSPAQLIIRSFLNPLLCGQIVIMIRTAGVLHNNGRVPGFVDRGRSPPRLAWVRGAVYARAQHIASRMQCAQRNGGPQLVYASPHPGARATGHISAGRGDWYPRGAPPWPVWAFCRSAPTPRACAIFLWPPGLPAPGPGGT